MKVSAGILLYRRSNHTIEFLLVHPGGPFWAKKDEHAWSIAKGETGEATETGEAGADVLEITARREFREETGMEYPGKLTPLQPVKTSGGKVVHTFLGEGDFDPDNLKSNVFETEWPPRSGKTQSFPEVDKAAWFDPETAKRKIHKGQVAIIDLAMQVLEP